MSVRLITYSEPYSDGCTFFGTENVFNVVEKVKSLHQNRQSDRSHRRLTVSYSWALLILNSQECPFPGAYPQNPNNRLLMPCPHNSTKCWTRVFLVFRMQIVAVQLLIHCFFLVLLSFLLKNMKYLHSKLNQWPNRPPRLLLLLLIFHNNDDQLTTCAVSETVLLTMDSRNCEILPGLPWTRPYHLDATTDSNWTLVNWIVSNAWPYY